MNLCRGGERERAINREWEIEREERKRYTDRELYEKRGKKKIVGWQRHLLFWM